MREWHRERAALSADEQHSRGTEKKLICKRKCPGGVYKKGAEKTLHLYMACKIVFFLFVIGVQSAPLQTEAPSSSPSTTKNPEDIVGYEKSAHWPHKDSKIVSDGVTYYPDEQGRFSVPIKQKFSDPAWIFERQKNISFWLEKARAGLLHQSNKRHVNDDYFKNTKRPVMEYDEDDESTTEEPVSTTTINVRDLMAKLASLRNLTLELSKKLNESRARPSLDAEKQTQAAGYPTAPPRCKQTVSPTDLEKATLDAVLKALENAFKGLTPTSSTDATTAPVTTSTTESATTPLASSTVVLASSTPTTAEDATTTTTTTETSTTTLPPCYLPPVKPAETLLAATLQSVTTTIAATTEEDNGVDRGNTVVSDIETTSTPQNEEEEEDDGIDSGQMVTWSAYDLKAEAIERETEHLLKQGNDEENVETTTEEIPEETTAADYETLKEVDENGNVLREDTSEHSLAQQLPTNEDPNSMPETNEPPEQTEEEMYMLEDGTLMTRSQLEQAILEAIIQSQNQQKQQQ